MRGRRLSGELCVLVGVHTDHAIWTSNIHVHVQTDFGRACAWAAVPTPSSHKLSPASPVLNLACSPVSHLGFAGKGHLRSRKLGVRFSRPSHDATVRDPRSRFEPPCQPARYDHSKAVALRRRSVRVSGHIHYMVEACLDDTVRHRFCSFESHERRPLRASKPASKQTN